MVRPRITRLVPVGGLFLSVVRPEHGVKRQNDHNDVIEHFQIVHGRSPPFLFSQKEQPPMCSKPQTTVAPGEDSPSLLYRIRQDLSSTIVRIAIKLHPRLLTNGRGCGIILVQTNDGAKLSGGCSKLD